MAVPTVGTVLAAAGTSAAGTTLTLTLGAGAAIGDTVFVAIAVSSLGISTVVDSKGNVYVNVNSGSKTALYAALVTKTLVSTDTVTVTANGSVQGLAATAVQVSGIVGNNVRTTTSYTATTNNTTGTSTTATNSIPLNTTHLDDSLFVAAVGTSNNGALALTDFTSGSVNGSYTRLSGAAAISTSGTTNVGVCFCYKTVAATNPMPSQNPAFTLNTSRAWEMLLFQLSAPTSRGSVGAGFALGEIAGSISTLQANIGRSNFAVNRGQVAKTIYDSFPKQPLVPSPREAVIIQGDPLITSE